MERKRITNKKKEPKQRERERERELVNKKKEVVYQRYRTDRSMHGAARDQTQREGGGHGPDG